MWIFVLDCVLSFGGVKARARDTLGFCPGSAALGAAKQRLLPAELRPHESEAALRK